MWPSSWHPFIKGFIGVLSVAVFAVSVFCLIAHISIMVESSGILKRIRAYLDEPVEK